MTTTDIADLTEEQLRALRACAWDLDLCATEMLEETDPVFRTLKIERVRRAVCRVAEVAAGADLDLLTMEARHGVRYERAEYQPRGTVTFPVTHAFPAGDPHWAWAVVSVTQPSSAGAILHWKIYARDGSVLLYGEERESVCGSRQQMIRRGLRMIRQHGGRRVWPRSRAQAVRS
jgi:hypothetical protein